MTTAAGRRLVGDQGMPWSATAESTEANARLTVPWWALTSSVVLPTLLVAAWVIAGTRQPASYSPVRQTVSVLSGDAATDRWIVTAGLYAVGLAYLVTALGMRVLTAASRAGLVVAGIAAIGVASFPQPGHGTSEGHAFFTGLGALAIAVWPALAARQESVLYAIGVGRSIAAIAVSMALFAWMALETRHGPLLGLAERTSSALQSCWPFAVALALRRSFRADSTDGAGTR